MTTPIDQSCAMRSGLCLQQLTPFVNTLARSVLIKPAGAGNSA